MNPQELEKRLIDFAVMTIEISESLLKTKAGIHLSSQVARSGTSPALNYAEAQDAESHKDFVHKMKIVLKELRETFVVLKIIHQAKLYKSGVNIESVLNECNQLIAIFIKSLESGLKTNYHEFSY